MAQANANEANFGFSKPEELKEILDHAEMDYQRSQDELYRPSTDVVLYSACFYARRALHHYLYYYYKKFNGPDAHKPPHELTVYEMARHCSKFNKDIKKIDFEAMNCSRSDVLEEEEVFFCNDVDKVTSCKSLAEEMRKVVFSAEK